MENSRYIKLKPEFKGFSRKIIIPDNFDLLMHAIKENYKNENPNKIYKITDMKTKKIIKNQNDYENLVLENFIEKEIKLLINIIDKPPEYKEESNYMCFKSNLIIPQKKELSEEEKIKQSIRELVQSKLKTFENSIIEDISKKIDLNPPNVHKGIKCSNCDMKNIVGIRYKCTVCPNYNLCEICEANIDHDEDHVLLKIRDPIISEKNLEQKIKDSIILLEIDFNAEPQIFKFKRSNLINVQTVYLTNNTNNIWKKNTSFVCIKEKSNLIGKDAIFDDEVKPGNYTKVEIIYDNMEDINKSQNEFYSSFILLDENKKQIGKMKTFQIKMS